jgi:hypothetical protein
MASLAGNNQMNATNLKNIVPALCAAMGLAILALFVVPTLLSEDIVYRGNFGQMAKGSDDRYIVENIHLVAGERYAVFLVYTEGFSFPPGIEWNSSETSKGVTTIVNQHGELLPDTFSGRTSYGNMSESGEKLAVFTATESGPQTLYLGLMIPLGRPKSDFEIVIRHSDPLEVVRLLTGGNSVWILVVAAGVWLWRRSRRIQ